MHSAPSKLPIVVLLVATVLVACSRETISNAAPPESAPSGMSWIPSGEFEMGSDAPGSRPDEGPPHRVRVSGFFMDTHEVSNAQFREFVEASGYVTTAERAPDWEELKLQLPPGTPKPPPEVLVPGSQVFVATPGPVNLGSIGQWWAWVPGADWRHPTGPDSSIGGLDAHPVVHVSWDDAQAYAAWAHKRLPTEAEWEWAARGGDAQAIFPWGNAPIRPEHANVWQGTFPYDNRLEDGFAATAPVGSFAPNGYGLYDMSGNVWEWCEDYYRPDTYARDQGDKGGAAVVDPRGPTESFDPQEPTVPKRVQRGGSFLCNGAYCAGYRVVARMKASPDSGLAHSGFRCVRDREDG